MSDYYASDVTLLPYGIISGKKSGMPVPIRLYVALRKALGWHHIPTNGRGIAVEWNPKEVQELPSTIREEFASYMDSLKNYEFQSIGINKTNCIGSFAQYVCLMVSADNTTLATVSAMRGTIGAHFPSSWSIGLRTDLRDGTVILTGSGAIFPSYLLSADEILEFFPTSTPVSSLLEKHSQRVNSFSPEDVVTIPAENTLSFVMTRREADLRQRMTNGIFRKLTAAEVECLRMIEYDFD